MRTKRWLALFLAALMCFAMLAGCKKDDANNPSDNNGNGEQQETGPDGRVRAKEQVYRTMYSSEVTTMNYLVDGTTYNLFVAANTIDALVEFDSVGNIKPALAESWEESDDGLTWTFHLRKGVKWVDNEGAEKAEVTANDWVAAAKYVLDPANASSSTYMFEGWVKNAEEYYAYLSSLLPPAEGEDPAPPVAEVKWEDVGVKAQDDYTLVYTLDHPRPYFPSALSFGCYFPAPAELLESLGENFAIDNTTMWFNGAYVMKTFEPQNQRTYVKNESYWDKENVHITEISQTYNSEASKLTPEMFMRGDVDYAEIDNTLIADWKNDPEKSKNVSPTRPTSDYSYFFCFNLEPKFGAEYEPDNWIKAVNNENFRQSIFYGLDRVKAMSVGYPENAQELIENTVTPKNFVKGDNGSYVTYGDLAAITERDSFNADKAKEYKDKAVEELKASGAKLPVIIPLTYNSGMDTWGQECVVVKQQLESVLGADYIQVEVVPGPSTGFLAEVRRAGKYGLMKCNWGADYADPETWTDPFVEGGSYNFAYDTSKKDGINQNTKTPETMDLINQYFAMIDEAKHETADMNKRYELFAKAEAFYVNHAFIIPFGITGGSYQASRLNMFEGQYAVFGLASQRYKGQWLYETGMGWDAYQAQYETWQKAMNS